jgi:hypothetical protein
MPIGGAPITYLPQNASIYPSNPTWQPAQGGFRAQQPSVATAPAKQRPIIRAQMGEDATARSRREAITLPSPEQLGVSKPASKSDADWNDARRRLDILGAIAFQVVHLPEGGCRFVCLLPTDQRNYNHRIEVDAASEADAVRSGLDRAEKWARQR